jgi:hypothetical protein
MYGYERHCVAANGERLLRILRIAQAFAGSYHADERIQHRTKCPEDFFSRIGSCTHTD